MNERPLVSVCIPTYNAAAFLEPCLQSAVAQTYAPLEILVCDDGSTDETVAMVKRFQQQHPQVKLVQNKTNGGMVANWNGCIETARGAWIKFLFQDDVLEPTCVAKLYAACRQQSLPVAVCRRDFLVHADAPPHLQRFFENGAPKIENLFGNTSFLSPQQLADGVKHHLDQNFIGEPTCCFVEKRFCLANGLFRTDMKQLVDYEWIVRLGLVHGLAFVPEPLAHFRVHGGSASSSNTNTGKAVKLKTITAETGDALLLLNSFLHDPQFALIKQTVGALLLQQYRAFLYHSACKHKGEKDVNEALQHIREKDGRLRLRYSFFRYVYYRHLIKRWRKKIRQETIGGNTGS